MYTLVEKVPVSELYCESTENFVVPLESEEAVDASDRLPSCRDVHNKEMLSCIEFGREEEMHMARIRNKCSF